MEVLLHGVVEIGPVVAGPKVDDGNRGAPRFKHQTLAERRQAGLRDVVAAHVGERELARDGGDVDEAAAVTVPHRSEGRVAEGEDGPQHATQSAPARPSLDRREFAENAVARVVDHQVECAAGFRRRQPRRPVPRRRRRPGRARRDGMRRDGPARSPRGGRRSRDVPQTRTPSSQQHRHKRPPETRARAGDEGGAVQLAECGHQVRLMRRATLAPPKPLLFFRTTCGASATRGADDVQALAGGVEVRDVGRARDEPVPHSERAESRLHRARRAKARGRSGPWCC